MARTNSRGSTSARGTGNLPFTQTSNMPPPILTDSRRDYPVEAWANQDQPFNSYTFSHQPQPIQRSSSQRKPELEQVPELDSLPGDNPADFLLRTGMKGTHHLQVPVSPMTIPTTTQLRQKFSNASPQSYNVPTPSTPMSDSLTTATTLGSNMSRQNSLCNEPLLESIQMMKFNSNTSFSTDINAVDHTLYDQVIPYSSRHSRRSSNEEQSQLLVGAGGASHDSQISHSFSAAEANAPQSHFSGSTFGEKMEKSESASSTSSTSSSRSKQRLQVQNALAAARPLMPKGGSDDHAMSRENSSQLMIRLDSKDGSQDKIAISKPTYQRPKHERVFCKKCEDHPDGFRGEHELRRHQDRQHKEMVKKWICIQPQQNHPDVPKPVVPLPKCKACTTQKKKYGAYYNAAAHLRRAHFKPKVTKGRAKTSKVEDNQKRGGKAGGEWPSMADLKFWMMEVEEPATDFPLTSAQQQEADESANDETFDIDDHFTPSTMNNMSGGSFDHPFAMSDASFGIYPSPTNTDLFNMQNMQLDLSSSHQHQQSIDSSSMNFTSSQSSFDNFPVTSSFQNDSLAFLDSSSLPTHLRIQNSYDDQFGLVDTVNFPYI